jgi:hypothetical protein
MSDRYTVSYGFGCCEGFQTFTAALDFLAKVKNQPGDNRLLGEGYDPGDDDGMGRSDGLTESERDAVEALLAGM